MKRKDFIQKGALGLGAILLSACAPGLTSNLPRIPTQRELNKGKENAMEVLGIQNPDDVGYINGYWMSRIMEDQIKAHAETCTNDYLEGQIVDSKYREKVYEGILREMLEIADEDGKEKDIIEFREGWSVLRLRKNSWRYVN